MRTPPLLIHRCRTSLCPPDPIVRTRSNSSRKRTANPSHRRLHGPTRGKLFTVRFHPIQATLRNHQHPFVQYLVVGARAWFTRRRISVRSASHPHFAWIQRAIRSQSESPSSGHSANRLRNTRTSLPVGRTSRLEKRQRVLASTP